jgi:cytochrome d ubiquinol oxidase subunit I
MHDALIWHRLQFAFTAVFHYLFPQLTIGLSLVIVVLKAWALRTGDERVRATARFWTRVFAINFAVGVVTGIPLEFQFGTNWARFSHDAGAVIGQSLAMEGMFAFFLESTFLGLLVYGEKRMSPRAHFGAAVALLVGSWLSAYFIVVTNAFMQHPVGHVLLADGTLGLHSLGAFLTNPWAALQYAHTITAALVTGAFVVSATAAFWTLSNVHHDVARVSLRVGVVLGLVATTLVAFPTGDRQAKLVARHQPVTLAAMEGRFESGPRAEITLIGQPNVAMRRLDNPIAVPGALSFIAYGQFDAEVRGLGDYPEDRWPTNIELLYYGFHVMVGLGTLMMALMAAAAAALYFGRLERLRPLLWALMLAAPLPYIANAAGWITAELGRQPWLVYGVLRTANGASPTVHSGDALFTLIGFCGLYLLLGLVYVFLMGRALARGPAPHPEPDAHATQHPTGARAA